MMFEKFFDRVCDKLAERVSQKIDAKCVQIIANAERDALRINSEAAAEARRIIAVAVECAPLALRY